MKNELIEELQNHITEIEYLISMLEDDSDLSYVASELEFHTGTLQTIVSKIKKSER